MPAGCRSAFRIGWGLRMVPTAHARVDSGQANDDLVPRGGVVHPGRPRPVGAARSPHSDVHAHTPPVGPAMTPARRANRHCADLRRTVQPARAPPPRRSAHRRGHPRPWLASPARPAACPSAGPAATGAPGRDACGRQLASGRRAARRHPTRRSRSCMHHGRAIGIRVRVWLREIWHAGIDDEPAAQFCIQPPPLPRQRRKNE
jgi:hypothetical protein